MDALLSAYTDNDCKQPCHSTDSELPVPPVAKRPRIQCLSAALDLYLILLANQQQVSVVPYVSKRDRELHSITEAATSAIPQAHISISGDAVASSGCFDCVPSSLVMKMLGHTGPVSVARWMPKTGDLLATGSMDNTVRMWDVLKSAQCLRVLANHTGSSECLYFFFTL